MLKLKDGAKGIHGEASFLLKNHKYRDNYVDQARFGDIDWITMENDINHVNHLTYAVITEDGQWHGPGEVGWFSCSSESLEKSQKWNDKYWDIFLANLSPDTLITIVDCHI